MIKIEHSCKTNFTDADSNLLDLLYEKFKLNHAVLPMFQLEKHLSDTLSGYERIQPLLNKMEDLVIFGTGGSSLGAQVLCKMVDPNTSMRVHFFDNIDPRSFHKFWQQVNLNTCLFLVISKSGSTPETLTQAIAAVQRIETELGKSFVANHMVMITEPKDSSLAQLAQKYGCTCLDHHTHVGGRFSVLSIVGLLPALILGVDIHKLIKGAQSMYNDFCQQPKNRPPLLESVFFMHSLIERNRLTEYVLMPYVDELEPLGRWFRQLWAESLGKQGKGVTPVNAMGTVDQHSQLQLYLDGPKNKLFTIIHHPLNVGSDVINEDLAGEIGFGFMGGKTMSDLMDAEQHATTSVLIKNGSFVRSIGLQSVSIESLGQLLVMFMIETILMADLMEVNCFDQPAVEQGKIMTKERLSKV